MSKTDGTRPVHMVAENIIAMVLLPKLSGIDEKTRHDNSKIAPEHRLLTPTYDYNSKKINNYDKPNGLPLTDLPNQINPWNQLPPVVQVAMFALDQNSAVRMANAAKSKTTLDIDTLLKDLFANAADLEAHDDVKGDLAEVESRLQALHYNYRLFVSDVSIRGARWSADATDIPPQP
jgi:uncharacterized protein (TIGR02599 family)